MLVNGRVERNRAGEWRHDWKGAPAIGGLKQSQQDFKPLLPQLSLHSRDVSTARPTRRFLHALTLPGSVDEKLELFCFSGPHGSGEFAIHRQPEKFIEVIMEYANVSDIHSQQSMELSEAHLHGVMGLKWVTSYVGPSHASSNGGIALGRPTFPPNCTTMSRKADDRPGRN